MDPRIAKLKSTTFCGRRFTRKQLSTIQDTVGMFPALSRRELAHTICEQLCWFTPNGKNKIQACLTTLDRLEALDVVSLPAVDESKKRGPQKRITPTKLSDEQPSISDELAHLTPITLQVATDKALINQWNERKRSIDRRVAQKSKLVNDMCSPQWSTSCRNISREKAIMNGNY